LRMLRDAIATAGEIPPANNHIPAGKACVREELWQSYRYDGGISTGETRQARSKAFRKAAGATLRRPATAARATTVRPAAANSRTEAAKRGWRVRPAALAHFAQMANRRVVTLLLRRGDHEVTHSGRRRRHAAVFGPDNHGADVVSNWRHFPRAARPVTGRTSSPEVSRRADGRYAM
jgi:hypothetical protein